MDSEKIVFEKGCFLPNWLDDEPAEQTPVSKVHSIRNKDLNTLLDELEGIKQHIQDVKEREWELARLINFHNNGLVRE